MIVMRTQRRRGFGRFLFETMVWLAALMYVGSWMKESISCYAARSLGLGAFIVFQHVGPIPWPVSASVWWVGSKPVAKMILIIASGGLAVLGLDASCLWLAFRKQNTPLGIVSSALFFYSTLYCPVEVYFATTVGLGDPAFVVSALVVVLSSLLLTIVLIPRWFKPRS